MIALRALGKAEISTPTDCLTPSQEILFAAALYLFLERAKPVARIDLAEALWPGSADSARQHRLRQTIFQLKNLGIPLEANRETVFIPASARESDLDVLFIHGAGDIDLVESLHFLPGYAPGFSRTFSDWLDTKRAEVGTATSRLLINDIRRARSRGDWPRVERLALKCMDVDPFNEEAVLARAEASAMRGAKREAVSILDRYVADLGPGSGDIKLPASLMRKRIAERVPEAALAGRAEGIFVGRESDMHVLTALLDDARAGSGRCCLLWGDAGIGKSRLAAELGRFGELQGVQVRRVACRRGDSQRPLSVFVEAVPQLLEMRGSLGCSPDTIADLQRLTQFDVASESRKGLEMDPQSIFELIRLAIFDLIDAVSEEQSLMLVVEDVQWLDAASARILGQLADWAAKKRLLIMFTSRQRENPLLEACTRAGLITHHVRPLSSEAATTLVREMFEATNERCEDDFLEWCRTVGDGNPFFLHELVKQWLETRQRHVVPPSITSVIRERFSRLSAEGTQLLQSCSVLGENSTLPRVEKMLQQEPYMLLGALNELSRAAMLSAERKPLNSSGDFRLATKHDLIAMVALEELDPHAEIFLHRRAGEVLELELGEDSQDTSLLWACAEHWRKAGNGDKSLHWAIACGELHLKLGCPKEAAETFAKAAEYASTAMERVHVLDRQVFSLATADEWLRVRAVIADARSINTIPTGSHDKFEVIDFEARWRSDLDHRLLIADLIPCIESRSATANHRVATGCLALKVVTDLSDPSLMDSIYDTISPLLSSEEVDQFESEQAKMIYHCTRGDGSNLDEISSKLIEAARNSGDVFKLTIALLNSGFAYLMLGYPNRTEALFLEAVEEAKKAKLVKRVLHLKLQLVRLCLDADRVSDARRWADSIDYSAHNLASRADRTQIAFALAKLAIAEENIAEATGQLEILNQVPRNQLSVMRTTATLALEVRLAILMNRSRDQMAQIVEDLLRSHQINRDAGRQDYEAYSVYLGLTFLERRDVARKTIKEYFRHRKEKTEPPAKLRAAADLTR